MNPRMAPTTIKTVPSGRLLVCMYGALAVGGTEGETIEYAPDKVGRPVSTPSVSAAFVVVAMLGTLVNPVADVPEPVIVTPAADVEPVPADAAVEAVFEALVAVAEFDVGVSVAVERLGSAAPDVVLSAFEPIAKRETATADVSSGDLLRSLMMDRFMKERYSRKENRDLRGYVAIAGRNDLEQMFC
jgi:hypothetical protein